MRWGYLAFITGSHVEPTTVRSRNSASRGGANPFVAAASERQALLFRARVAKVVHDAIACEHGYHHDQRDLQDRFHGSSLTLSNRNFEKSSDERARR